MNISDIITVSNRYGSDPAYVLAGGGNSSYKDGEFLYVKGSGVSLAVIDESGFVKMERSKLQAIFTKHYPSAAMEAEAEADMMDARCREEILKRPSVEALLHEAFPQTYVLHVHPSLVNGITCSCEGESAVTRLFGDKAAWLPSINPGVTLGIAAKNAIDGYFARHAKNLNVLFIGNHGVFFAANTVDELDALVSETMTVIREEAHTQPDFSPVGFDCETAAAIAPAIRMLVKKGPSSIVTFLANACIMQAVASWESFEPLMKPFTPDHIVYCSDEPLFVRREPSIESQYDALTEAFNEYASRKGHPPKIVAVCGLGLFACGRDKKESAIVSDMFIDAMAVEAYTRSFGGPLPMSEAAIDFIVNWESEKYRQKVSLSGGAAGSGVAEKIIVITGGAQGFGQGIASHLAAASANLVIADINGQAAQDTAKTMQQQYKRCCAAIRVDVTDEDSVKSMLTETTLMYGGVDVFISNAGINKAGGLDDLDAEAFERVNRVNYTAYFLGAKYAAKVMKIQHRFAPDYMMDIIQINSKSGLAGSNKNFAYAGSKFGGIGLTQSFALELVHYNIKVNAICPGNFFESPLWSDPVNGLFVQYLNSGKAPGATTVEDIKKFYEAKVPMGRGCGIPDVAKAVMYVIEQAYETGQAVPVTGGQVMLS